MNAGGTRWIVAAAAFFLFGANVRARTAEAYVSRGTVRQAIAIFERDPTSAQGSMARPLILQFAQSSPDVEIVVGQKLMPWMVDKPLNGERGAILLTAYIAGDTLSQLDGGQAHSTALVAACEQVIATYRQLQRIDPGLRASGVEKLIELRQRGQLPQYVREGEQDFSKRKK